MSSNEYSSIYGNIKKSLRFVILKYIVGKVITQND